MGIRVSTLQCQAGAQNASARGQQWRFWPCLPRTLVSMLCTVHSERHKGGGAKWKHAVRGCCSDGTMLRSLLVSRAKHDVHVQLCAVPMQAGCMTRLLCACFAAAASAMQRCVH